MITVSRALEQVWPATADALGRYLRRRGASDQDTEDVLQECAIRVLHARPTFTSATDLTQWCIPVVRNLRIDQYRRGRHEMPMERVPDEAAVGDVADRVSHTLELGRVLGALQQLRPADREAIVAHVRQSGPTAADRREAVRLNVQRHRARQRLLARLAAVVGAIWGLARRTVRVAAPATLPAAMAIAIVGVQSLGVAPRIDRPQDVVVSSTVVGAPATQSARAAAVSSDRAPLRRRRGEALAGRPGQGASTAKRIAAAHAPTGDGVHVDKGATPPQNGAVICVTGAGPVQVVCVKGRAAWR